MYVYLEAERGKLWIVGHYAPVPTYIGNGGAHYNHSFVVESEHTSARDAAARCNYLNGGEGNAKA